MGNHNLLNQLFMVMIEEVEVMVRSATTDDGVGVTQLKEASSKLQK
jgi:hypothetical protein